MLFFHSWRVKIIGKSHHEWPKIVIHGNECIILFLTRYFMSWTHHPATNKHRSLISLHLALPRFQPSHDSLNRPVRIVFDWGLSACTRYENTGTLANTCFPNRLLFINKSYKLRGQRPISGRTYFRHICSLCVNFMQLWFFVLNRFLI